MPSISPPPKRKLTPKTRDTNTNDSPNFHPSQITPSTFAKLLGHYPETVKNVRRNKAIAKIKSKTEKGAKRKADTKPTQNAELSASDEKIVTDEVNQYLDLDRWRYETLPELVRKRRDEGGGVEILGKEDVEGIMEWKLKHGRFRPALLSMIKSNNTSLINKCISEALKTLPTQTSFPKQSLDALSPLRGVGPATASLILAILTTHDPETQQVPFYSDDTYLWIWFKEFPTSESGYTGNGKKVEENSKYVKPSGELNVKYNAAEYKQFWEACVEVRERLGEGVCMGDVEKVGFVLRHIGDSGFWENKDESGIGGELKGEGIGEEKKSEDVVEGKGLGEEMKKEIESGDGDGERRRSSRTSKRAKKD